MEKFKVHNDELYFMGDLHLNHDNILKPEYDNRPFKDCDEMKEVIIKNIKNTVPKDGVLVLVGDTAFKKQYVIDFLDRIDRKVIYVKGNHDNFKFEHKNIILMVDDIVDIHLKHRDEHIIASHFAQIQWEKSFHGAYHTHAHSHGMIEGTALGDIYYKMRVMDVGVMNINYRPIKCTEVIAKLESHSNEME